MDIYLKIDGVDGDVESTGYSRCIAMESLDFDVEAPTNTIDTGSRVHRPPVLSCITLTKWADSSSVALFKHSCVGAPIKKVTISCVNNVTDKAPCIGYILDTVYISSYSISVKKDDEAYPLETIKLSFRRIEFKFTKFNKSGDIVAPMRTVYDIDKAATL